MTKAQTFRVHQQRTAHPDKPKQPKRPRRDVGVDTALPGVSATDRKQLRRSNEKVLAAGRGGAALEETAAGRPSRKSTRKSVGRTKRTTNKQLQAIRATTAPSARATRSKAKTAGVRKRAPARAKRR